MKVRCTPCPTSHLLLFGRSLASGISLQPQLQCCVAVSGSMHAASTGFCWRAVDWLDATRPAILFRTRAIPGEVAGDWRRSPPNVTALYSRFILKTFSRAGAGANRCGPALHVEEARCFSSTCLAHWAVPLALERRGCRYMQRLPVVVEPAPVAPLPPAQGLQTIAITSLKCKHQPIGDGPSAYTDLRSRQGRPRDCTQFHA